MPSPLPRTVRVDAVVLGGGVTGLWTLHQLLQRGYQAVLLEEAKLGGAQTMASQGVLHGGLKYALNGVLNDASETIGAMPQRWADALRGSGEIDLRAVEVLSPCQYLWPMGSITSRVAAFFASKTLESRSVALEPRQHPPAFSPDHYRGSLYRLEETVVNAESLVREMARPVADRLFQVDWEHTARLVAEFGHITHIDLPGPEETVRLTAERFVLAAGKGNGPVLEKLGCQSHPAMQLRPLHQVVVKAPDLPELFVVGIGAGTKPPLVATTHPTADGQRVWYLGGELAEEGVHRDGPAQVSEARKLLAKHLPWVDLSGAAWASFRVDRAEGLQPNGSRPDGPLVKTAGNAIVAWPTKLVLAPLTADLILAEFEKMDLAPGGPDAPPAPALPLPAAAVAQPVWEELFRPAAPAHV
ncbi:MAG: FAD-dependent oxidoreductase [Verrucomicrobiota bacterium]